MFEMRHSRKCSHLHVRNYNNVQLQKEYKPSFHHEHHGHPLQRKEIRAFDKVNNGYRKCCKENSNNNGNCFQKFLLSQIIFESGPPAPVFVDDILVAIKK